MFSINHNFQTSIKLPFQNQTYLTHFPTTTNIFQTYLTHFPTTFSHFFKLSIIPNITTNFPSVPNKFSFLSLSFPNWYHKHFQTQFHFLFYLFLFPIDPYFIFQKSINYNCNWTISFLSPSNFILSHINNFYLHHFLIVHKSFLFYLSLILFILPLSHVISFSF